MLSVKIGIPPCWYSADLHYIIMVVFLMSANSTTLLVWLAYKQRGYFLGAYSWQIGFMICEPSARAHS